MIDRVKAKDGSSEETERWRKGGGVRAPALRRQFVYRSGHRPGLLCRTPRPEVDSFFVYQRSRRVHLSPAASVRQIKKAYLIYIIAISIETRTTAVF